MTTSAPTGYTDDEITTSVEQLVLSSISRPYDTLGTRRVDISFNDVQQAAAGVFLNYPTSPFYVAFLGAQRLLELVTGEVVVIDSLLTSIAATGRRVFPINDLTPLANSTAALVDLEAAVGQRSQGFKSIDQVPAFQRFQSNLQTFLNSAGSNIKDQGQIVQTPQEAQAGIPAIVTALMASHAELVRRATNLAAAMDDYAALNLPSLAAADVVTNARTLLQAHQQTLEGLSPTDRLAVIRPMVLDMLSAKAVVQQYGSFSAPSQYLLVTGIGVPYSDATDTANAGGVTGDLFAPFPIATGQNLLDVRVDAPAVAKINGNVDSIAQVTVVGELFPYKAEFDRAAGSFIADGVAVNDIVYVKSGPNIGGRYQVTQVAANALTTTGTTLTVVDAGPVSIEVWRGADESITFASSYLGQVDGSIREPFLVTLDNQNISFSVGAVQVISMLPFGSQTANDVCTQLNADIVSAGVDNDIVAEPFLSPLKFDGIVDLVQLLGTGTFTLQTGQFDGLGLQVGDQFVILSGALVGTVYTISAVDVVAPLTFFQAVTGAVADETGIRVQVGPAGFKVRLRLLSPGLAVQNRRSITIASVDPYVSGNNLLGWPTGAVFNSRPTTGQELVTDYNSKALKTQASVNKVLVDAASLARSKPEDNSKVVLYFLAATADIVATAGQVVATIAAGGVLESGANVGDSLVLRTGSSPDSVWTITALTDTTVTATSGLTTTSATGLSIELGPTLSITRGMALDVTKGGNTGTYYVKAPTSVPFEMQLEGVLPVYKDQFSQPVLFTVSLYQEQISITSRSLTVASQATVNGSAAALLNSAVPYSGHGTTTWFFLPNVPAPLQVGDYLDIFATDYTTPTDSFQITGIDTGIGVIHLDHAIDSLQTWSFADQAVPFAKLRAGHVFDYTTFKTALTTWLNRPENQPAYFTDLNRFLNPLLVSSNPTNAQVNDATNKVFALIGLLDQSGATTANLPDENTLEFALENYSIDPVPQVDTLINSFTEKGSDRATDLLTEGQFSVFFGLSVDGASYSGAMQESMRSVAMNDLAVRKSNRTEANASPLQGTTDDPDYEYDQSDIDDEQVDPPAETMERNT